MDLLYILIAQVGGTPDFSTTPPPGADMGSWWPLITTIMSLVVAATAALFTAWQKLRERKLENSASSEQSRLQLEIEELKHQFESRKQLHDQLSTQITNLLTEGRELREELKTARTEVSNKETLISELRAEVTTLQSKICLLYTSPSPRDS